jgi:hypothetical protein
MGSKRLARKKLRILISTWRENVKRHLDFRYDDTAVAKVLDALPAQQKQKKLTTTYTNWHPQMRKWRRIHQPHLNPLYRAMRKMMYCTQDPLRWLDEMERLSEARCPDLAAYFADILLFRNVPQTSQDKVIVESALKLARNTMFDLEFVIARYIAYTLDDARTTNLVEGNFPATASYSAAGEIFSYVVEKMVKSRHSSLILPPKYSRDETLPKKPHYHAPQDVIVAPAHSSIHDVISHAPKPLSERIQGFQFQ